MGFALSGTGGESVTLTMFIIVGALAYLIHCAIWPYKPCRSCHGRKRHMAFTLSDEPAEAYRHCQWCGGSGERLRLGKRALNRVRS